MAESDISTKRCPKCNTIKDRTQFSADARTPTGLKCYCRQCVKEDMRERRALKPKSPPKNRAKKIIATRTEKLCPKCSRTLPLEDFGKDVARPGGLKCWCKDCHNQCERDRWGGLSAEEKAIHTADGRAWRQANPNKNTIYMRRWREGNPDAAKAVCQTRRARKLHAEGRYSTSDVAAIFKAQSGKCAYCRKPTKSNYHVDHIIPLAKGGSNWPRNLQLTCASCNSRKHAKDPIDFAQGLGRLL